MDHFEPLPDPTDGGELARRRAARRQIVLDALADGMTYAAAGQVAGCSERTVRRFAADPPFAADLARRRALRVRELTGRLSNYQSRAVDALVSMLDAEKDADRLRAATALLNAGERLRAATDLDLRLTVQEQLVDQLLGRDHQDDHDETDPDELLQDGDEGVGNELH